MNKCLIIGFFICTISHLVIAQPSAVDSLKQELALAKTDENRVLLLSKICAAYMFTRPDSALFYGYTGLAMAREIEFHNEEVILMTDMVTSYSSLGNSSKALQLNLRALKIVEEHNLSDRRPLLMLQQGGMYNDRGRYRDGLRLLKETRLLLA